MYKYGNTCVYIYIYIERERERFMYLVVYKEAFHDVRAGDDEVRNETGRPMRRRPRHRRHARSDLESRDPTSDARCANTIEAPNTHFASSCK